MVPSPCCSFRRPRFGFWHSYQATHNCLEFQLQGINALTWLPQLTSMQVRILTQRYIHINEKNILFLKKEWISGEMIYSLTELANWTPCVSRGVKEFHVCHPRWPQTHCVAKNNLEILTLLPPPLDWWDFFLLKQCDHALEVTVQRHQRPADSMHLGSSLISNGYISFSYRLQTLACQSDIIKALPTP